jgi:hypothetical protein
MKRLNSDSQISESMESNYHTITATMAPDIHFYEKESLNSDGQQFYQYIVSAKQITTSHLNTLNTKRL